METGELEARLGEVLRSVLGLERSQVHERVTRETVPEWDSLRHVKLMLELQKEFGVRFSATEVMGLDSFGAILAALRRKS